MKLVKLTVSIEEWQREAAYLAKINLSELLREALNAALNVNSDAEKLEQELQIEKALITAKEAKLAMMKQQAIQSETNEKLAGERKKWLSEHPNTLTGFTNGTLSTKAWSIICAGLKVRNRLQAEKIITEFQNEDIMEQPDVL